MLPYQTTPDESGDWPYAVEQNFLASLYVASLKSKSFSAYWNATVFATVGFDNDYFVLGNLSAGQHTLRYLNDWVAHLWKEADSTGGFNLSELNYYTTSTSVFAPKTYTLEHLGGTATVWDTEAQALASQLSGVDTGLYQYGQLDFVAHAPGLYKTVQTVSPLGFPVTQYHYHTGRYFLYGTGNANDVAYRLDHGLLSFPSGTELTEQLGAGRYVIALDEYLGVRDRLLGPGWFDEIVVSGPNTGVLKISGLEWTEISAGTWTASGNAVIGLKGGEANMLSVKGGAFVLVEGEGGSLSINGAVASIIEGKERALFAGKTSLSLDDASGTVVAGSNQLELGGLMFEILKLQLVNTAVRLPDTSFTLPAEFAERAIELNHVAVTIGKSGVDIADDVGIGDLRLLNLAGVKTSFLDYSYDGGKDEITIGGKLQIGESSFFPTPVDASLSGGIHIAGGEITGDVKLAIDKILGVKGFGFNKLELTLSTDTNKVTGAGEFLLPFPTLFQIDNDTFVEYSTMQGFYAALPAGTAGSPDSWGLGVSADFLLSPLKFDGIGISVTLPAGIPLYSTPFAIKKVGVGVTNLASDNPAPVGFKGLVGIEGIDGRIFKSEINVSGEFSKEAVSADVDGYLFAENLVSFTGKANLNWVKDTVDAQLSVIFIDGLASGNLGFKSDFDFNVNARGNATIKLLGNEISGDLALTIRNDGDSSNDYVAVWGTATVDLPLIGLETVTKGIKYAFDGKTETFGAADVPLYASWVIDETISDLMVTVQWENATSGPVHTRVLVYDDLAKTQVREVIAEADYAAHGIAVIQDWSGPLGTVVYVAAPEPGLWDVEVLNPQGLGLISYSASTSLAPGSLSIDAVAMNGALVTIDYSAVDPNGQAGLLFFADEDAQGYDGILVGSALESDGAGLYVWDTSGFAAGRYWLYALMEDGQSIPLSDYAADALRVNLAPNVAPVVAVSIDDQVTHPGAPFSFQLPLASFVDPDSSDVLSYAARLVNGDPLPAWLAFDASTRTFTGTPGSVDAGAIGIRVTATDAEAASAFDDFSLHVQAVAGRSITGTVGDDPLVGGAGNDTVDGRGGIDTLSFSGALHEYLLSRSGAIVVTVDSLGRDGTDTATAVERLQFTDMGVNLTVQAAADSIPGPALDRIAELYVGLFGRVPAANGLEYWIGQYNAGQPIDRIADAFYAIGSGPDLRQYTGYWDFAHDAALSDAAYVAIVYRNVLGREGLSAGINYWTAQLQSGAETRGSLVSAMLDSAHTFKGDAKWGWVADLLDDRVAISKMVAVDWGLNYARTPEEAISKGMAIVASVIETPNPDPALSYIPIKTFDLGAAVALVGIDPAHIDLSA